MSEPAATQTAPPPERFVSTRERVRGRSWAVRLLGLFSSVTAAAVLIAALAIVVGGATVYEMRYGREATAVMIYQRPWFAGIFLLLAVCIFGAAAVRWPWRRNQTGFVIVHAGLLFLILGFFLAGNDRLDGSLIAAPGREAKDIELPRDSISVALDDHRAGCELQTLAFAGYPSFPRFVLGELIPSLRIANPGIHRLATPEPLLDERRDGVSLRLLAVCDTARSEAGFVAAGEHEPAEPAARIALSARTPMGPTMQPMDARWLTGGERGVQDIGPLTATFSVCSDQAMADDFIACAPVTAERGVVHAYWRGRRHDVEIPATLPAVVELAPDLALDFKRYIPRPVFPKGGIENDDQAPVDPILIMRVGVGEGESRDWRDHPLTAYHLLPPPPGGPDLLYEHPQLRTAVPATAGPAGLGGWAQLLGCPDGKLRLRWFTRTHGFGGAATIDSTWSGDLVGDAKSPMELRADITWIPRATQAPEPVAMQPEFHDAATRWIEVEAERNGHRGRAWLPRWEAKAIPLDDGTQVLVRYTQSSYSLLDHHGFVLTLAQFYEGQDPDRQHAASYASDVTVRPMSEDERKQAETRLQEGRRRAIERMKGESLGRWLPPALVEWLAPSAEPPPSVTAATAHISMNEPLRLGGVTIYQSSYEPETDEQGQPTGRQLSIFTVAQDRGRWAKYLGSVLLVAGIITMYLMRVRRARPAASPT